MVKTLAAEIEEYLARETLTNLWFAAGHRLMLKEETFYTREVPFRHAEGGDDGGWWDPPWNEMSPRELAEQIPWLMENVISDIAGHIGASRHRPDAAVRPDETGISWDDRYFYAIARTLGWDAAMAERAALNDEPEPGQPTEKEAQ